MTEIKFMQTRLWAHIDIC